MSVTVEQLAAWRALERQATPGPWRWTEDDKMVGAPGAGVNRISMVATTAPDEMPGSV